MCINHFINVVIFLLGYRYCQPSHHHIHPTNQFSKLRMRVGSYPRVLEHNKGAFEYGSVDGHRVVQVSLRGTAYSLDGGKWSTEQVGCSKPSDQLHVATLGLK